MKRLISYLSIFLSIFTINFAHASVEHMQQMSPKQSVVWLQEALRYGFNMKTHDYNKYMSTKYIEKIDGKTFNFKQWVHHMETLKGMMQSYQLRFDSIVANGDQIAASYRVFATKQNGEKLEIKVVAIFKIKNGKMIACDELTHLLSGPEADTNLASHS